MTNQENRSKAATDLWQKAEAIARQATRKTEDSAALSPEEIQKTLHDLRVHQVELEMQNEELRTAQAQIEAGRERYYDLYDLAPVGYCTLSGHGLILEANLTVATLLRTTRGLLVKQPISRFILKDDQNIYYLHRKKLFETGEPQECELRLVKPDGADFWAHLTSTATQAEDGAPVCRCVISDINERKMVENALQRVRFSIENLSEGVFWVGETGYFTDVNTAACRKLGYTREELLTMSVADIDPSFPPEQWAPHWEEMKQCGTKVLETVHHAKNGNLIPMELVIHHQLFGNQRYNCVLGRDITERKQAEEALRNSEARFRHLLQSVPNVAVQGYGPDGTTRYWNEASEHLYGYTAQEAIGRNLIDLIIPTEMRGEVEQAIQQMAETGQPVPASEVSLMRKDGSRVSVFSSHATVQIPAQAPELYCIDIDITERKQAEDKLRDSELFLHTTINSLKGHICVLDETGKIVLTNQAWDDFAIANGADPQCVSKGVNYLSVCDSVTGSDIESASSCSRGIRAVLSGESPEYSMEYPCHSPTEKRWFLNNISPLQRKGSRWVVINHENITERKLAEAALKESALDLEKRNNFINTILENLAFGLAVTFVDSGVTKYINPAYSRLYGWPAEDMKDIESFFKLIYPDPVYSAQQMKMVMEDINSGNPERMHWVDFMITTKTGEERFIEARNILLPDQNLMISTAWDITDRKRAEEERDSLQAQLYQAQKLESLGRLAGGMTHDFNNMLGIILGYGDVLSVKLHPGDPLQDDVKEIVKAGRRSAALTRQLLAFSRKQKLQPEVLDLNTVIRTTEKMLRRLIREDIELEVVLSDEIDRVMADPGQIEQVIMNLSVNARDAMPKGGKLILETANVALDETYAKSHASIPPGKYVMLALTDTGCGMDKETLSKIFEPFFTTKEMGKGTGLGLATVYGIVKQSGGYIWAYSEPGSGTKFKIYLPQTLSKQEPKVGAVEKDNPNGDGEHILVVEDEDSLRKLIGTALSTLGYEVSVAANGGEALLLMEKKALKPDLVITDVVMPYMSGKELMNRLQINQPYLKVLYMSGYTDDVIVHHGVLEPGAAFIQKPFTIRGIAEKVQAVLRGGGPLRDNFPWK